MGSSRKMQRNSSANKIRKSTKNVFFPYRESKLTKIMKSVWTGHADVSILGHLKYFSKEEDNSKALDFLSKVFQVKSTDPFEKMLNAMNKFEMKGLLKDLKKEKKDLLEKLNTDDDRNVSK